MFFVCESSFINSQANKHTNSMRQVENSFILSKEVYYLFIQDSFSDWSSIYLSFRGNFPHICRLTVLAEFEMRGGSKESCRHPLDATTMEELFYSSYCGISLCIFVLKGNAKYEGKDTFTTYNNNMVCYI